MLAKLVKSAFRKTGIEVIPRWRLDELPMSQHLARIFHRYRIDCVLDVGANTGQFRDFVRSHIGYRGRVVSYEPVSELVDVMRSKSTDSMWTIENLALGAKSGHARINVMLDGRLNSMLKPSRQPTPVLAERNVIRRVDQVPMLTLDEAFRRIEPRPKSPYLKLDTQGFDLQVAQGGLATLESVLALQCEASVIGIYEGMPSYREAVSFFESAGFTLSGMFPVTLDADLRLVEFDCVMVRR